MRRWLRLGDSHPTGATAATGVGPVSAPHSGAEPPRTGPLSARAAQRRALRRLIRAVEFRLLTLRARLEDLADEGDE